MEFDLFSKLVNERQSCRDFNDKELSVETVEKIVDCARFAPSACNSQPWKMYCVVGGEKLTETAIALGMNGHNKFLKKAKAFIVVADKTAVLKPGVKFDRNHFVRYDVGELLAYITLGAKSLGVDSCIIGMVDQNLIGEAVGLENGEVCNVAVALGYSDGETRKKLRKSKEETVKFI